MNTSTISTNPSSANLHIPEFFDLARQNLRINSLGICTALWRTAYSLYESGKGSSDEWSAIRVFCESIIAEELNEPTELDKDKIPCNPPVYLHNKWHKLILLSGLKFENPDELFLESRLYMVDVMEEICLGIDWNFEAH